MMYLIVECRALNDQFECDADRTPICVTEDYSKYNKYGYEVYEIKEDGSLKLIRDYEDISEEYICVCIWNDLNEVDDRTCEPDEFIKITNGDRNEVTKSMVKKIKKQYGFTESLNEIYDFIQWSGDYGEEINGKWIAFGEGFDNSYPTGI